MCFLTRFRLHTLVLHLHVLFEILLFNFQGSMPVPERSLVDSFVSIPHLFPFVNPFFKVFSTFSKGFFAKRSGAFFSRARSVYYLKTSLSRGKMHFLLFDEKLQKSKRVICQFLRKASAIKAFTASRMASIRVLSAIQ